MATSPHQNGVARANHDLLVQFYGAVGRGELRDALDLVSDDIEWRVHRPAPSAGTYHGKREVLDWFSRMAAPYEGTLRVSAPAMVADRQYGFVLVHESAERPAPISYTGVHVWQFAEGKISRFESYYDESYVAFWSTWSTKARRTPPQWTPGRTLAFLPHANQSLTLALRRIRSRRI